MTRSQKELVSLFLKFSLVVLLVGCSIIIHTEKELQKEVNTEIDINKKEPTSEADSLSNR